MNPDRPVNEDSLFVSEGRNPSAVAERGWLYVVSDGMGGEAAGEVASRLGVDVFKEHYYHEQWAGDPAKMLAQAVQAASEAVRVAADEPGRRGMGATLTALALHDDGAYVVNLGDSRCYLVRDGAISQLTEDHTFVARMVRKGLMTHEDARTSPKRNIISRYLGMDDPRPDLYERDLRTGDTFLLMSDGVHGVLSDEELRDLALQHGPKRSVIEIVEKVKSRGAPDNATVIVVKVGEVGGQRERVLPSSPGQSGVPEVPTRIARRLTELKFKRAVALVGLVVLVLLITYALRRYLPHPQQPAPAAIDSTTVEIKQPESESGKTARPESLDSTLPRDSQPMGQPGWPPSVNSDSNEAGSMWPPARTASRIRRTAAA